MANFAEDYTRNYDALTATTKGAAPQKQIMWASVALTVFEAIQRWVEPDVPKRMQVPKTNA